MRITCYRLQAEQELLLVHWTLRAIQDSFNFETLLIKHNGEPELTWITKARNHWPDYLTKAESITVISRFEIYAKAILFSLYMKKVNIEYLVYSSNLPKYFSQFNGWFFKFFKGLKKRGSFQTLTHVLDCLESNFNIKIELNHQMKTIAHNTRAIRNAEIHDSSYRGLAFLECLILDSDYSLLGPDRNRKDYSDSDELTGIAEVFNNIIGEIDREVINNYDLPKEILIFRKN